MQTIVFIWRYGKRVWVTPEQFRIIVLFTNSSQTLNDEVMRFYWKRSLFTPFFSTKTNTPILSLIGFGRRFFFTIIVPFLSSKRSRRTKILILVIIYRKKDFKWVFYIIHSLSKHNRYCPMWYITSVLSIVRQCMYRRNM